MKKFHHVHETLQSMSNADFQVHAHHKHSPKKLGQVSGITSIPEVERSIDSSTSVVYRPLAIQILAPRAPTLI